MDILTQNKPDVNGKTWEDRIPFLGEVDPAEYDRNLMPDGSDPAAMDAEIDMPLVLWIGIYREEPWTLEPAWGYWEV